MKVNLATGATFIGRSLSYASGKMPVSNHEHNNPVTDLVHIYVSH